MSYNWTIQEKLVLAVATVFGWYHIVWISIFLLMPTLLNVGQFIFEPLPAIILTRAFFLICYVVVFVLISYRRPALFVVPTWFLITMYLSFHLLGIAMDILNDMSSVISWGMAIRGSLICLLLFFWVILKRPALFYVRLVWRKLFA